MLERITYICYGAVHVGRYHKLTRAMLVDVFSALASRLLIWIAVEDF